MGTNGILMGTYVFFDDFLKMAKDGSFDSILQVFGDSDDWADGVIVSVPFTQDDSPIFKEL